MPPRRVYPSWLPPNPREREGLLKIRRWQRMTLLWMAGFIPAGWLTMLFAGSADLFVPFTAGWVAAGILMGRRVVSLKCPRCGQNFSDVNAMPYWHGLFGNHCENCGVSLKPHLNDELGPWMSRCPRTRRMIMAKRGDGEASHTFGRTGG